MSDEILTDEQYDALIASVAVAPAPSEVLPYEDAPNGSDVKTQGFFAKLFGVTKPLPHNSTQAVAVALGQVNNHASGWSNLCDRFVGYCYGLAHSGYVSAQAHWNAIPSAYRHTSTPPKGALMFWRIGTNGHVALSLGNGYIASNDIVTRGHISVVKYTLIHDAWGATYLGWTDAVYTGYSVYRVPIPTPPKPTPPPAAKPTVSLAHVQKAAATDPGAAQGHKTYPTDVLVVEKALNREGLLAASYVDGSYGTKTIEAYSAWQRKLGYTGSDADGVPGSTSLTALGKKYGFNVVA